MSKRIYYFCVITKFAPCRSGIELTSHLCNAGSTPRAGKLVNRFWKTSKRVVLFLSPSAKMIINKLTAVPIDVDRWRPLQFMPIIVRNKALYLQTSLPYLRFSSQNSELFKCLVKLDNILRDFEILMIF